MTTILFWFRRDLRLHDNIGLYRARTRADRLYPVFIVDPNHPDWPHRNGDRLAFKLDCVRSLAEDIHRGGGKLIRRHGNQSVILPDLADKLNADAVFWNRCYEPYERRRDQGVRDQLEDNGITVETFKDQVLFEQDEITTQKDDPYKVFSYYAKTWKQKSKPDVVEPVNRFDKTTTVKQKSRPDVSELGLEQNLSEVAWTSSESAARNRMSQFLSEPVDQYDKNRDYPCRDGTSRLSPYIRFGLVSVRELYWESRSLLGSLDHTEGVETFVEELIWRDFYHQILYNYPRVATSNFREKYDSLEWERNEPHYTAWKNGQTGYPIVDAGMRQLNQTGWMHNRLRMIVASFLTKDLLIHWKQGERYFMNRLLDGDTAANNGGWQWAASTGTDAVPYFRMFNPVSQSEQYDPDGEFIRQYCGTLRALPDKHIHAPFNAPSTVLKKANVTLGENYPKPIVDHATARERTLKRFEELKD